ncbi:MAG: phasin family protein [Xanthomonadales bacterium]|jgi:poly(hydroxyalkanoate) granule-associated protein|nr:phasin family protein [Xanthomonadales bacterium]
MAKFKASVKAKPAATKAAPKTKKANAAKPDVKAKADVLSRSIMESAQSIWLAGMGAFGRAQEEGTKLFDSLIKEGSKLEQKTRKLATGQVDAVRGAVESGVGQVRERATDTWDKLEKVFEDRVQRALVRLGVPSSADLSQLATRVDGLTAELRKVSKTTTTSAVQPAKKKPAAKVIKPAVKATPKVAPSKLPNKPKAAKGATASTSNTDSDKS